MKYKYDLWHKNQVTKSISPKIFDHEQSTKVRGITYFSLDMLHLSKPLGRRSLLLLYESLTLQPSSSKISQVEGEKFFCFDNRGAGIGGTMPGFEPRTP